MKGNKIKHLSLNFPNFIKGVGHSKACILKNSNDLIATLLLNVEKRYK